MKSKAQGEARRGERGRFAYEGLDRVIHERARLSVLTSLITHPKGVTFGDLKALCSLTDGNLSRHLQVLEKTGMVVIAKGTERNRPLTVCRITAESTRSLRSLWLQKGSHAPRRRSSSAAAQRSRDGVYWRVRSSVGSA